MVELIPFIDDHLKLLGRWEADFLDAIVKTADEKMEEIKGWFPWSCHSQTEDTFKHLSL